MITPSAQLKPLAFLPGDIAGLSSANLFGFTCQAKITMVFCKPRSMSSHLPIQNHNPAKERLKNSPLQSQNLYQRALLWLRKVLFCKAKINEPSFEKTKSLDCLRPAKVKELCNATSLGSLLLSQVHRAIICPAETIWYSLLSSPVLGRIIRLFQAKNHMLFSAQE
jgi:hypothetical protein